MNRQAGRQAGSNKRASGFTLIELVVVIVILGILAATALPKFVDLSTDARIAVVDSTAGALRSSAEMILSKCAVTSGCSLTGDGQLTIGGRTSKVWYGYPLNRSRGGEYWGIDEAMQISGSVTYSAPADYYAYFKVSGARDPDTCVATYKHNDTTGPTISTTTTGC